MPRSTPDCGPDDGPAAANLRSERRQRARIAAHARWAQTTDSTAATASARAAFLSRFDRQVDPEGVLSPGERGRRAEHARKAYFARLALASARKRAGDQPGRPSGDAAAARTSGSGS